MDRYDPYTDTFLRDTQYNILGTNLAEVGTDCISRQAAINAIDECYCGGEDSCGEPWIYKENAVEAINMIEPLPPAEPKRGKWIRTGSGSLYDHYECSECGKAPKWECMGDNRWKIAFTDFCPNCGAKMEVTT